MALAGLIIEEGDVMEQNMGASFPKQFAFAKSLSGKYLFACENLAKVAGFIVDPKVKTKTAIV